MPPEKNIPAPTPAPAAPDSGGATAEAPGIFLPRDFLKAQFADAVPGDSGTITLNYTVNSADDSGVDVSFDSIVPEEGYQEESETEPEPTSFEEGPAMKQMRQ